MTDESKEMLEDLVEEFARRAQLYGCDAIQVLLSVHDEKKEDTENMYYGRGNWYARQGMCSDFMQRDVARTREYVRVSEFGEDEDG